MYKYHQTCYVKIFVSGVCKRLHLFSVIVAAHTVSNKYLTLQHIIHRSGISSKLMINVVILATKPLLSQMRIRYNFGLLSNPGFYPHVTISDLGQDIISTLLHIHLLYKRIPS